MTNLEKEEKCTIPAGDSSSDYSIGSVCILLPRRYGGLDGVLFFDGKKLDHDSPLF